MKKVPQTKRPQNQSAEIKYRLTKACDGCSLRKVKCDASGPPCQSCAALDIPCTFQKPSRKRGPPNRHAEALKSKKLQKENGSHSTSDAPLIYNVSSKSAALSTTLPLSAESICDFATLNILINNYFIYIYPLIPLPHEPTFRAAFLRRDDKVDRSFLALLASMIEILVASFPRRPRQLFTSDEARKQYPNAGALITKCHQVFVEARGIGYLDRDLNLYDACGSYFAGLTALYMFDMHRNRLYFAECVTILRSLNFHKPDQELLEMNAESPVLGNVQTPQAQSLGYIDLEVGRRLFWLCFVGCLSLRQLGGADANLLIPPLHQAEILPPMPREVDDEYIFDTHVDPQPPGNVSTLTGFNLNIHIFHAFHALTTLEMAFGTNELYDWDRQRRVIRQALSNVKAATLSAPLELQLRPIDTEYVWSPIINLIGLPGKSIYSEMPDSRRDVQYEIQKANIYATQLATRSYLVEKFWNLYEIQERGSKPTDGFWDTDSPIAKALAAGVDYTYRNGQDRTPSDYMDAGEHLMAIEREDIIRDLAVLLRNVSQVNMEPNGLSFCNKIRQVASTLLETKRARMSVMPTLDSEAVNAYLYEFLDILSKLERLGSSRIRVDKSEPIYDSDGFLIQHREMAAQTPEETEEEELVHWASLREHQERFVKANGFLAGI